MTRWRTTGDPIEDASHWVALEGAGDLDRTEAAQLSAWLAADPAHRAAYEEARRIWRESAELSQLAALEPVRVEVPAHGPRPNFFSTATARNITRIAAALVVAVGLAILVGIFLVPGENQVREVQTAVGEIEEIELADGSLVTLGPKSRIAIAFSPSERNVTLEEGEAFFSVLRDAGRPFIVTADQAVVRVLGTKFNVHSGPRGLRVAVAEGEVEVIKPDVAQPATTPAANPTRQRLSAGQQILSRPEGLEAASSVAADRPGSWRNGLLFYENSPLREVVADANRYSETPIVIASPALDDLAVFAVFRADQIDGMLQALAQNLSISVDHSTPGRIILKPKAPQSISNRG